MDFVKYIVLHRFSKNTRTLEFFIVSHHMYLHTDSSFAISTVGRPVINCLHLYIYLITPTTSATPKSIGRHCFQKKMKTLVLFLRWGPTSVAQIQYRATLLTSLRNVSRNPIEKTKKPYHL